MAGGAKFATFTHFVKVNDSIALALHTHVLPRPESDASNPLSWFEERYFQELMVLAHEVICSRATENLAGNTQKCRYHFKRSGNLRVLFTFKSYEYRQHLVIPTNPHGCLGPPPLATFVNEYGRRVIPFLNSPTTGSGCKPFRVLSEGLHAFIDSYELTSSQGIFKVLLRLDPAQKPSMDIASYFQPSSRNEEREEGGEGMLLEVPVAGLRGGKGGSSKAGRGRGRGRGRAAAGQGRRQTRATTARQTSRLPQQPTIPESLTAAQRKGESPVADWEAAVFGEYLPSNIIDEFFDFDSQPSEGNVAHSGGVTPVIRLIGEEFDPDATPPLPPRPKLVEKESTKWRKLEKLDLSKTTRTSQGVELTSSSCSLQEVNVSKEKSPMKVSPVKRIRKGLSLKRKELQDVEKSFDDFFESQTSQYPTQPDEELTNMNASCEHLFEDDPLTQEPSNPKTDGTMDMLDSLESALFDISTPMVSVTKSQQPSQEQQQPSPPTTDSRTFVEITNTPLSSPLKSPSRTSPCKVLAHQGMEYPPASQGVGDGKVLKTAESTPLCEVLAAVSEQENVAVYLSHRASSPDVVGDPDVEEVILISSGDESTSNSQNQERPMKRRKKRKRQFNLQELREKSNIKQLSSEAVYTWLCHQKRLLVEIFQRKVYSRRHEDFVSSSRKRAALQYQFGTGMFTQGQIKVITDGLMKVFCAKNMKYFSYAMSVLFPECLIRFIADFHDVTFEEAERIMYHGINDQEEEIEID